jgi:hypothetical protein
MNKSSIRGVAGLVCLLSCLAAAPSVGAQDAGDATGFKQEVWVASGFLSYHVKNRDRYRQGNSGIGAEWRFARQWQLNAGHYNNSVGHDSNYFQVGWMPLAFGADDGWRVRAGASVGVVNGYPNARNGGYFPTLVPVLSVEWKRVGMNVVYIPTVGGRVDGAVALQLKARVF